MYNRGFSTDSMSLKDRLLSLNFKFILVVILICIISVVSMYSTDKGYWGYHTISHLYRLTIFFTFFIFTSLLKPSFWHKYSYLIYFLILFLLIGVDIFGVTASGSKRWINLYIINLQPSELMKVGVILFLARYYNRLSRNEDINKIKYLYQPLLALLVPIFLVIAQPDLGTALLIASSGIMVLWITGLKIKYFVYTGFVFLASLPFAIAFLKPYQKLRVLTFLNPDLDPLGAGYQIIQSKIAVGSGGIFGKGFLQGTQSYLGYLPEKHTDFIFTLYSEEFGFLGSSTLLILYVLLIYLLINIGRDSKSNFAKIYTYGFASMLFICIAVNMSMVLGLLPIVGAPLPIMSYGGSAMLATMFGLGIAMGCHINKSDIS